MPQPSRISYKKKRAKHDNHLKTNKDNITLPFLFQLTVLII